MDDGRKENENVWKEVIGLISGLASFVGSLFPSYSTPNLSAADADAVYEQAEEYNALEELSETAVTSRRADLTPEKIEELYNELVELKHACKGLQPNIEGLVDGATNGNVVIDVGELQKALGAYNTMKSVLTQINPIDGREVSNWMDRNMVTLYERTGEIDIDTLAKEVMSMDNYSVSRYRMNVLQMWYAMLRQRSLRSPYGRTTENEKELTRVLVNFMNRNLSSEERAYLFLALLAGYSLNDTTVYKKLEQTHEYRQLAYNQVKQLLEKLVKRFETENGIVVVTLPQIPLSVSSYVMAVGNSRGNYTVAFETYERVNEITSALQRMGEELVKSSQIDFTKYTREELLQKLKEEVAGKFDISRLILNIIPVDLLGVSAAMVYTLSKGLEVRMTRRDAIKTGIAAVIGSVLGASAKYVTESGNRIKELMKELEGITPESARERVIQKLSMEGYSLYDNPETVELFVKYVNLMKEISGELQDMLWSVFDRLLLTPYVQYVITGEGITYLHPNIATTRTVKIDPEKITENTRRLIEFTDRLKKVREALLGV